MLNNARLLSLKVVELLSENDDLPEVIPTAYTRDPWVDHPEVDLVTAKCDIGPGAVVSNRSSRKNWAEDHRVFLIVRQFMAVPTNEREEQLLAWHSKAVELLQQREALVLSDGSSCTLSRVEASQNLQHRRDKRVLSFFAELFYAVR